MQQRHVLVALTWLCVLCTTGCDTLPNTANRTRNTAAHTANALGNAAGDVAKVVGNTAGSLGNAVQDRAKSLGNVIQSPTTAGPGAASPWLHVDNNTKTATLKLIAGYNQAKRGFNFNGYGSGDMTVTVPRGWKVKVDFENRAAIPHSAMIVPFSQRLLQSGFTPAFSGATTPNASKGDGPGRRQSFSFIANQSGHYALICAVRSHSAAGMWNAFVVSDRATHPVLTTK